MKNIILILFLSFAASAHAQDYVISKFDDGIATKGKYEYFKLKYGKGEDVHFENVVHVDSNMESHAIYKKTLDWVGDYFSSAYQGQLGRTDFEEGIINASGKVQFPMKVLGVQTTGTLDISVKIQARDGRYKLEMFVAGLTNSNEGPNKQSRKTWPKFHEEALKAYVSIYDALKDHLTHRPSAKSDW